MPLPLQTEVAVVSPNTYRYDVSIASRISDGKLIITVGLSLQSCSCDEKDVWEDCFTGPTSAMIPDLAAYAVANPELAPLIAQAWGAINALVAAINAKDKLL